MSELRALAMLLTDNRASFIQRAVDCFRAQTYKSKSLLIYDSGTEPAIIRADAGMYYEHHPEDRGLTIGALRNLAMAFAHPLCLNADIIVHWDSDDWSHSNRIAEQVALLQASGADCVGYNEMLFWRTVKIDEKTGIGFKKEEAWLYTAPPQMAALGTSLCYWRKTWEKKPFADTSNGEDLRFIEGLNVKSVSSCGVELQPGRCPECGFGNIVHLRDGLWECETEFCKARGFVEPRMVASIHGGNTHCRIVDQSHEPEYLRQWKRIPQWDGEQKQSQPTETIMG